MKDTQIAQIGDIKRAFQPRASYRLEFSGAEIDMEDWAISKYPSGVLTKMMIKANELGLEGKKIKVIEVKENFATMQKYVEFILDK